MLDKKEEKAPVEKPAKQEKVFPCWMYHKSEGAKIFKDADALKAAGKGWQEEPFPVKEEKEAK